MNSLIFGLLISVCVSSVLSLGFGKCPDVNTVANFSPEKYEGKWYEIKRGPRLTTLYEEGLRCVQADYKILNEKTIQVLNGGIKKDGKLSLTNGTATIPDAKNPAKLIVSFPILGLFKTSGNYWVIDTDYKSYSLVYSCRTYLGFLRTETVWILSRSRTLSETSVAGLKDKIGSFSKGLLTQLIDQDQKDCPN